MDYPQRDETHFVRCLKCLKILKCSRYDTSTLLEHIRTDHPEIEIVESVSQSRNSGSPLIGMKGVGVGIGVGVDADDGGGMEGTCNGNRLVGGASRTGSLRTDSAGAGKLLNMDPEKKPGGRAPVRPSPDIDDGDEDDAQMIYTRRYKVSAPPSQTQTHTVPNSQTHSQANTYTPRKLGRYRSSIEKWQPTSGSLYCPKCGQQKRPLIKSRAERMSQNSCGSNCLLGCWPFCFLPFLCAGEDKEYLHCSNCKTFLGLYDRKNNCIKPNREFLGSSETNTNAE